MAHPAERKISDLRIVLLILRAVGYLDTVEVTDSSSVGPTTFETTYDDWPASAAGLNPVMAALMGMMTGIGGGILRDILVNQTATVLKADLYAVAALAAGIVEVVGRAMHYPSFAVMTAGALLCFWLRVMAILRGWRLPIAGTRSRTD